MQKLKEWYYKLYYKNPTVILTTDDADQFNYTAFKVRAEHVFYFCYMLIRVSAEKLGISEKQLFKDLKAFHSDMRTGEVTKKKRKSV